MIIRQSEAQNVNNLTTTGQFRQQLENRQAKKLKKVKEHSRKSKYDGVVKEREIRSTNEIKQLLDGRSDPLKRFKVIFYN